MGTIMNISENVSMPNTSECLEGNLSCSSSNGTFNVWENEPLLVAYYWVIDAVNVLSNLLIIFLIYKENKTLSSPNKLMIYQAVADMNAGIMYLIFGICMTQDLNPDWLLFAQRFLAFVFKAKSLQVLSGTAFCLFVAICYPIWYRVYNSVWRVNVFIVATWLINIVVASSVFLTDEVFNPDIVFMRISKTKVYNIWHEILKIVCLFLLPIFGVGCFVRVMVHTRSRSSMGVENQSDTRILVQKSIAVMILSSVYCSVLLGNVMIEILVPVELESWGINVSEVVYLVLYHYIILKLPLFLIVFEAYRSTAKHVCCFCRNKISSSSSSHVKTSVRKG